MQNITLVILFALLFCASIQARAAQFLEQSKQVEKACTVNLKRLSWTQWVEIGAQTKQSPMTEAAICYRDRIRVVASESGYQYAGLANRFAEAVVKISMARDDGKLPTPTAMALYRKVSVEFRTFLALDDKQAQPEESRRIQIVIDQTLSTLAARARG